MKNIVFIYKFIKDLKLLLCYTNLWVFLEVLIKEGFNTYDKTICQIL